MESDIDNIDHECLKEFLMCDLNGEYDNFEEYKKNKKHNKKNKKSALNEKKSLRLNKIIPFTYLNIMKMPKNEQIEGLPLFANFSKNVLNVLYDKHVLHHSHITGAIIGYAHGFCNRSVRENKNLISVIAHNLFVLISSFCSKV